MHDQVLDTQVIHYTNAVLFKTAKLWIHFGIQGLFKKYILK